MTKPRLEEVVKESVSNTFNQLTLKYSTFMILIMVVM